jgi:protoporphyrinogen oxidase
MSPVVILGAGPAGLAAAHALVEQDRAVTVLERSTMVGGLARTVEWKGYRFDVGGHRFFTRYPRVQSLWEEVMGDDFLERPRLSRILYGGKLFDYPLSPTNALLSLGPIEAARCTASFGRSRLRRREPESFEDWVSQRFGRRLYQIFFRTYTEKVWGIPCTELSADWAAQRIKDLSLGKVVREAFRRGPAESTSLIEAFHYPRLGPGMLYERMAEQIEAGSGTVSMEHTVTRVHREGHRVTEIEFEDHEKNPKRIPCDHVLSSIPLTVLIESMDPPAPDAVREAARSLSFRHLVVVNLVVDTPRLFDDTWIYVHSPELQVGRLQNYRAWSPEMVPSATKSTIGLEYFTGPGDALWEMTDEALIELATRELAATGLIDAAVLDGMVIRAPRAYPVYARGYEIHLGCIVEWLRKFENLQPIGRYGMFKYNNSDHSIFTALLAVDNLLGADHDVWAVNADESYHEAAEVEG